MRIQFSGQFATLRRFEQQVAKAPQVLDTVNEQLAHETAFALIPEAFERSTDPYGKRWEPLKLRDGRPLEDTGQTKASFSARNVSRDGFTVGSAKETTIHHQDGTGLYGPRRRRIRPRRAKALRLPGPLFVKSTAGEKPRKMVPDPGDLPPPWLERYIEVATEVLAELFR